MAGRQPRARSRSPDRTRCPYETTPGNPCGKNADKRFEGDGRLYCQQHCTLMRCRQPRPRPRSPDRSRCPYETTPGNPCGEKADQRFAGDGRLYCQKHCTAKAGRQPWTVPTASTMVKASTTSTIEARNVAEIAGAAVAQVIMADPFQCSGRWRRCQMQTHDQDGREKQDESRMSDALD